MEASNRQIIDSAKKLTVSCYGLVHGKSNHITGIFKNSKTRNQQIAICYYKFLYAICYCYMLLVFAISLLFAIAIMLLCY